MERFWKIFRALCAVCLFVEGIVFALYFLNLDQRLLDWGYRQYGRLRGGDKA